jgi:hypothetical protein
MRVNWVFALSVVLILIWAIGCDSGDDSNTPNVEQPDGVTITWPADGDTFRVPVGLHNDEEGCGSFYFIEGELLINAQIHADVPGGPITAVRAGNTVYPTSEDFEMFFTGVGEDHLEPVFPTPFYSYTTTYFQCTVTAGNGSEWLSPRIYVTTVLIPDQSLNMEAIPLPPTLTDVQYNSVQETISFTYCNHAWNAEDQYVEIIQFHDGEEPVVLDTVYANSYFIPQNSDGPFGLIPFAVNSFGMGQGDTIPAVQEVPAAPILHEILEYTQTTVNMSWSDQSIDEDGFRIERKQDNTDWETDGSVSAGSGIIYYQSTGLQAHTTYSFRVIAFNDAGDSNPSNEQTVITLDLELPSAPTDVQAVSYSTTMIQVRWQDPGVCDSFQIDRRTVLSEWARVIRTPDGVEIYNDFGLMEGTTYFYRVGSVNAAGISWSADSAVASTPAAGAPASPSDLEAEVTVGIGVVLSWTDNATDEIGFIISRGETGHQFQTIDSVNANSTAYLDSLGDLTGMYNYRVRAFNEHGNSEWTQLIGVNYEFCSDGIIPLCLSPSRNFWRYAVEDEENDTTYEIERVVADVDYIENIEHYLIIEHPFPQGEIESDSVVYLKNFSGEGCRGAAYPLTQSSTSELLFQYPIGGLGTHYFYHGDSVLVISRGTTMTVSGVTYTGVLGYQRFLHGLNRSIRYWVKPEEMGIIREEEVVSSQIVLTRDVTTFGVNN